MPKEITRKTARIYKLVCNETGKIYIGSTTHPLSQRLSRHKYAYKRYKQGKYGYTSSYEIIKKDNFTIKLIEEFPFQSGEHTRTIEGKYIRKYQKTHDVVNMEIAGRTPAEYKATYYKQNKDIINLRRNEKFSCECGGKYTRGHKSHHFKSKKHQNYLKSKSKSDSD